MLLEGINRRITEAEEGINDLEDRMVEITGTEQKIGKRIKEMKRAWDLWDNIKRTNTHIIGVSGEEKEKTWENIWK